MADHSQLLDSPSTKAASAALMREGGASGSTVISEFIYSVFWCCRTDLNQYSFTPPSDSLQDISKTSLAAKFVAFEILRFIGEHTRVVPSTRYHRPQNDESIESHRGARHPMRISIPDASARHALRGSHL